MFVIPMLGQSSRFFNAGFALPKYELPINGRTVFESSVRSFEKYFKTDLFIFVVRNDFGAKKFVEKEIERFGISNSKVIELAGNTKGQAETVALGLRESCVSFDEEIFIFNIDTFRPGFEKPSFSKECDGYLEVFEGDGEHWSFIEPGKNKSVLRTTEKERISNLCSDGLYFFKNRKVFENAYNKMIKNSGAVKGEYYIAPMYNYLILDGNKINYELISIENIVFCGTPDEYYKAGGLM